MSRQRSTFLLAWLVSLRCPLLNRPSAQCLRSGAGAPKGTRRSTWNSGAPDAPERRFLCAPAVAETELQDAVTLTVAGSAVGTADAALKGMPVAWPQPLALSCCACASTARRAMQFTRRQPMAGLDDPDMGEAIWNYFAER
jgi:hypothetical protein